MPTGFTRGYSRFDPPRRVFPILYLNAKKNRGNGSPRFCFYSCLLKLTTQLVDLFAEVKNGVSIARIPFFQSTCILYSYLVLDSWKDPGGIT